MGKLKVKHQDLMRLDRQLSSLKGKIIRVGIRGDKTNSGGKLIVDYAIANEYGLGVPSRPFFRTATEFGNSEKEIQEFVRKQVDKIISTMGGFTAEQAANAIGEYIRGRIVDSIINGNWTPNAPATLAIKGNKPPLIDSSDMIGAIEFEVLNG